MDAHQLKLWIQIVQGLITISAALIGGFWAWSRFVVERGLMPPSQMDISLRTVGFSESATILELSVEICNKGSSALVVCDLRVRLRYLNPEDEIRVIDDPAKAAFGRVNFLHAQVLGGVGAGRREVRMSPDGPVLLASGEFLVVPYDTFVQPGVAQYYSFVTALPRTASYVLVRSSFRYQLRPSKMQRGILRIGRQIGMFQYSLSHIREPHTVEKSFNVCREGS